MRKYFLLLFLIYFLGDVKAQSLTAASGNTFSNTSGQLFWSVGEVHASTLGTNLYTGLENLFTETLTNLEPEISNFSFGPNPTNGEISISGIQKGYLSIFSLQGQLIFESAFKENEKISLNVSKGVYLLKVEQENQLPFSKKIEIIN